MTAKPLTVEADCVAIATVQGIFDYDWIVQHARKVFDTRNVTARVSMGREKILRLCAFRLRPLRS